MSYQYNPLLMEGEIGRLINAATAVKNNAGVMKRIKSTLNNKAARQRAANILKDVRRGDKGNYAKKLLNISGDSLKKGEFGKSDDYKRLYKKLVKNPRNAARATAKMWKKDPSMIKDIVNNTGYSVNVG